MASNASIDARGRLVVGPCRCGAAAPFGAGVRLTAVPPKLGTWRCRGCHDAWQAGALPAAAAPAPGAAAAAAQAGLL